MRVVLCGLLVATQIAGFPARQGAACHLRVRAEPRQVRAVPERVQGQGLAQNRSRNVAKLRLALQRNDFRRTRLMNCNSLSVYVPVPVPSAIVEKQPSA